MQPRTTVGKVIIGLCLATVISTLGYSYVLTGQSGEYGSGPICELMENGCDACICAGGTYDTCIECSMGNDVGGGTGGTDAGAATGGSGGEPEVPQDPENPEDPCVANPEGENCPANCEEQPDLCEEDPTTCAEGAAEETDMECAAECQEGDEDCIAACTTPCTCEAGATEEIDPKCYKNCANDCAELYTECCAREDKNCAEDADNDTCVNLKNRCLQRCEEDCSNVCEGSNGGNNGGNDGGGFGGNLGGNDGGGFGGNLGGNDGGGFGGNNGGNDGGGDTGGESSANNESSKNSSTESSSLASSATNPPPTSSTVSTSAATSSTSTSVKQSSQASTLASSAASSQESTGFCEPPNACGPDSCTANIPGWNFTGCRNCECQYEEIPSSASSDGSSSQCDIASCMRGCAYREGFRVIKCTDDCGCIYEAVSSSSSTASESATSNASSESSAVSTSSESSATSTESESSKSGCEEALDCDDADFCTIDACLVDGGCISMYFCPESSSASSSSQKSSSSLSSTKSSSQSSESSSTTNSEQSSSPENSSSSVSTGNSSTLSQAESTSSSKACQVDADCNTDERECTQGTCFEGTCFESNFCLSSSTSSSEDSLSSSDSSVSNNYSSTQTTKCTTNADCDDSDACTDNLCFSGTCFETNICTASSSSRSSSRSSRRNNDNGPGGIFGDVFGGDNGGFDFTCGNGIVETGEQCDFGSNNAAPGTIGARCACDQNNPDCRSVVSGLNWSACRWAYCGDGRVNNDLVFRGTPVNYDLVNEECDDGNGLDGDGCSANCKNETTQVASGGVCGDGVIGDNEQCDDGNRRPGDGCSANCGLEDGYCGDSVVQIGLGEQCEPSTHDTSLTYGCTANCRHVSAFCGNGIVDAGEECDAGNANSNTTGAACRTDCSTPRCGDSVLDPGEQCDDGNRQPADGCDNLCRVERRAAVAGVQTTPVQTTPNGVNIPFGAQVAPLPNFASPQALPYDLPAQYLQPYAKQQAGQAPAGDTGPAALAVMIGGAAGGVAWVRRKRKNR